MQGTRPMGIARGDLAIAAPFCVPNRTSRLVSLIVTPKLGQWSAFGSLTL